MTGVAPSRKWATGGIPSGFRRTIQRPGDAMLALRIGFFLLSIPRRMAARPLDALLGEISNARRTSDGDTSGDVGRISRLRQAWLESPALRARNTCYIRAITLYRFLDPGSRTMRIHFGVEPGVDPGDRLRGHAWVTLDGELLEAPEPVLAGRVRKLYVYPPDA